MGATFNQVGLIYENEDIFIRISEIVIHETNEQYDLATTTAEMNDLVEEFQCDRPTFNGDVAYLLKYIDGTTDLAYGIANNIGGLCNNDINSSPHIFVALHPDFEEYPTYSRQVKVLAHEMGHVLGSYHTHACRWNGDDTALDNCAPHEGTCLQVMPEPPLFSGTIMSYCDHNVGFPNGNSGVQFENGFGPQPGFVIRTTVDNAECLDCDILLTNDDITTNSIIQACDVIIRDLTIENPNNLVVNYSGTLLIEGTFSTEIGTTIQIIDN